MQEVLTLTAEKVFDAALWIQIREKRVLTLDFEPGKMRFWLPPNALLAKYCKVEVETLDAALSEMAEHGLVFSENGRTGTTPWGNLLLADLLETRYEHQVRSLFGQVFLRSILKNLRATNAKASSGKKPVDISISKDNPERSNYPLSLVSRYRTCKCCGMKFATNDNRRKYCDRCRTFRQVLYEKQSTDLMGDNSSGKSVVSS